MFYLPAAPPDPWSRVVDAIRQLTGGTQIVDTSNGAYMHDAWTWLDEPLPAAVEAAVAEVAAQYQWDFGQTRASARRMYYEELRRVTSDHLMLHEGMRPPDAMPPLPIKSLPAQPPLDGLQLGYLHAQGQLIGDQRPFSEADHHRWHGILDYGGWLVTDPRNLEGPVASLESRVEEFVSSIRKRMPRAARRPEIMAAFDAAARSALYHAYWYRLNVRLAQVAVARLHGQWQPRGAKPSPQAYGVSHQGAEQLCAEWLAYLGATNVRVTRSSGDGGIDVVSDAAIAQVKNYAGTVGVEEIRAFHGVASVDGRLAVFFTSGRYANGAVEFADRAEMPLLTYNAGDGSLGGANSFGTILTVGGIARP